MRFFLMLSLLALGPTTHSAVAQVGGNINYGQGQSYGQAQSGKARAEQHERAQRTITREEMPPTDTSLFVDASILMNVPADEFVATFGLAAEAATVAECQTKMDATVASFRTALAPLNIKPEAIFVDFAAQTKVYGYKIEGSLAKQYQTGFELKKTIAIRYRDKLLIDRLVVAASQAQVFDLIKVDYVVTDPAPIQDRLAEAAAAAIKTKTARYERLLGIKLRAVPQIYAERSSTYFPTAMYDSYNPSESDSIQPMSLSSFTVENVRRSRTFFFNPLDADGFDRVIDPVILEPIVQFTYYLKLKYEIELRK